MCTHTLWNELDRGAEALRREAAVPPDAERAFPSVEGHDPAQDLEAVLAGPHHAGPEEIGRLLRLGEIHDRLVAVLLELALTERGHRPGCLGLRHTRSATPLGAIRPPHALWRRGPRSVQEPVRLELGRDLLDGLLDVRGLARAGAHDLAAAEHEQDDLRLVDAIHEAGELLRLVLDGTEPEGDRDRVQVDLGAEVRRGHDVLHLDLRILRDRDAGGLDLLRDQFDRHLDVLEALRARAHDLPAAEQQDRGLRILDPVDEPGELLRLVLGAAEGEGDRLEVELVPEGSRRDDVLDPELGHLGHPLGRDRGYRHRWRHLHATGALYTSVRPEPARKTERTLPETAGPRNRETLPTPHVSMRSTRPFASTPRSKRRKAWVSAPLSAITSPPRYAVPVSQSLTTRSTRYRGFCRTAMNSAIFAAAHESLKVPWKTARRRCAMIAILFATSFRKERLWLTTRSMPGYVFRAAATISWLSMSRWFVGSSRTRRS